MKHGAKNGAKARSRIYQKSIKIDAESEVGKNNEKSKNGTLRIVSLGHIVGQKSKKK